jgi:hypothetical protein
MQNEKRLSRSKRYKRQISGLIADNSTLKDRNANLLALIEEIVELLPEDRRISTYNRIAECRRELNFDGALGTEKPIKETQ